MTWNPWLSTLNDALADLYPDKADARRVAANAGVKTGMIDFEGGSLVRWFNILSHVERAHGDKPGYPPRALAILEQALKDYHESPAQQKWYEAYTPIRERSTTFDITN